MISSRIARTGPRCRWLKEMSSTRSLARAASAIDRAEVNDSAIGFSDRTWIPASSAAMAIGACSAVGVATLITSRSPSVIMVAQSG